MATRPAVKSLPVTRDKLKKSLGSHEMVVAWEALTGDSSTLADSVVDTQNMIESFVTDDELAAAVSTLNGAISGKASQAQVDTLAGQLAGKADQSQIVTLQTEIDGKADIGTVTSGVPTYTTSTLPAAGTVPGQVAAFNASSSTSYLIKSTLGNWLPVAVPRFATLAALRAVTDEIATTVWVECHTNTKAGGGGLYSVAVGDTTSFDNNGTKVVDATGRRWDWRKDQGAVNQYHFGALGDSTGPGTGTDDQPAFQSMSDWVIYFSGGHKCEPKSGQHRMNDTWHVGYGVLFNATTQAVITIEGAGAANDGRRRGTILYPTNRNRPTVAITNGRGVRITGIGCVGDPTWFTGQGLDAPQNVAAANLPATWVNPAWPASATSQTAPWAAFVVDPYALTAPSTAYPDVVFPSWLIAAAGGSIAQYGKPFSSDTLIDQCFVEGFPFVAALSPSGEAGQDDFFRLTRSWAQNCVYGVAVSHTDSRLVTVRDSYLNQMHTVLTNTVIGAKTGQFGAEITNCAFDRVMQWFDFGDNADPRTGPTKFQNCYGENVWRLGNAGTNPQFSTQQHTVELNSCKVKFNHGGAAGVPASILALGDNVSVDIHGGMYRDFRGVFSIVGKADQFTFSNQPRFISGTTPTKTYAKNAQTSLACVSFSQPGQPILFTARHSAFRADTGVSQINSVGDPARCDITRLAPVWSRHLTGTEKASIAKPVVNPANWVTVAKSSFSALSLSDLDLSLTFTSRGEIQFSTFGPLPGDTLVDTLTGSVFFVYSRSGSTVLAKLQNNYRGTTGAYTYLTPIDLTLSSGTFQIINGRLYTPSTLAFGTLTSGSATITAVGQDDGTVYPAAQIPVGASIWTDPVCDHVVAYGGSPANNLVTAIGAGTVTLQANAAKSERRPVMLWMIPTPANDATG